jgi:hypothetical protein
VPRRKSTKPILNAFFEEAMNMRAISPPKQSRMPERSHRV